MKYQEQVRLSLLLIILVIIFPVNTTHAKSMIEPCSSSDSCPSLLSYVLPFDSQLSEIAFRFKVTISDILAANSINPTTTFPNNLIFHAKSILRIPISCPCVDGIRRSMSTTYTVRPADSVDSISEGFGGLVSGNQISSTNGISAKNPLMNGQTLVIPLPCTCFNNSDNGLPAVYMSYVVRTGENLDGLAMEFGTTVAHLEAVNGLDQPLVQPGDILAIPISACSSANLNWHNESIIVANGSYALTANNCIKCNCLTNKVISMQCSASGVSCSHLQCKGSSLFIGDTFIKHTPKGCNVSSCIYRGHYGRKIFRSLVSSSNVPCPSGYKYRPGYNQSNNNNAGRPSFNPTASPPPPCTTPGINGSRSRNTHHPFNNFTSGHFITVSRYIPFLVHLLFLLNFLVI